MVESSLVLAGAKYLTILVSRGLLGSVKLYSLQQIAFAPHYTVNGLARCASDRTDRKRFGSLLWCAVVACCDALLDDLGLSVESRRATLNQWHVGCQTHFIDVAARFQIVQCVEDNLEITEPSDSKLFVLDICVVCGNIDIGVEPLGGFLGNECFGLFNVLLTEKKLAVQVREIDRVEIDNVDLAEAHEDQVFEQLAPNASSSNHEHA